MKDKDIRIFPARELDPSLSCWIVQLNRDENHELRNDIINGVTYVFELKRHAKKFVELVDSGTTEAEAMGIVRKIV